MAHGKKRRQGGGRPKGLPDYVVTAHERQHPTIATSEATFKSHAARRGEPLTVSRETVKLRGMRRFSADELLDLKIDKRYQREEVSTEVRDLIHVIKRGGQVTAPITVVERKYGDHGLYIVDGQQRWWAHVDTLTPIHAVVYTVESYDDEVTMFQTLNTQSRLSARTRVASWPRAAGTVLHRLNEDETSPLFGRISFADASMTTIGAIPLLRGLLAVLSNVSHNGAVDRTLMAFDKQYEAKKGWADDAILRYATIIAQVFHDSGDHRLRTLPAMALGKMCHAKWRGARSVKEMALPNERQISRLRNTNWSSLLPNGSVVWMPTVLAHLLQIWPVTLVSDIADDNGDGGSK
jgi:hypothetical protein